MAGKLKMKTVIELEGQVYHLETTPGTTKLDGQTIPPPHRRRIDAALRTVAENIKALNA